MNFTTVTLTLDDDGNWPVVRISEFHQMTKPTEGTIHGIKKRRKQGESGYGKSVINWGNSSSQCM